VAGVGAWLSGKSGAYRYLAESARRFYNADEVATMLREAGLETITVQRFLGGVAAIHVAVKPTP
jgi:demethylmenaquinone methyltransferase/2-methoxy-6-polyprenyl-1,4-benzoquinol methylase